MKRINQIDAFAINTDRHHYIVTLERIKNDINGNGRYKAVVVVLDSGTDNFYNAVYTFTGHCRGEAEEAKYIIKEFERGLSK